MARTDTDELDVEIENPQLSAEAAMAKNMTAGGIPKNFRQQADMEAFYRFVFDNDLREEALTIFDQLRAEKNAVRIAKSRVKH